MSGHSKWAKIKRQKGGADAKRGILFGKLSKEITIIARDGGGDLETNFKLRLSVERAKSINMPKDTIDRAIKKGTGELAGGNIEEFFYEAYGPNAIPFIIQVLTDNKNRSVADIRHIFSKNGGTFGTSVMWMFDRKGIIRTQKTSIENFTPQNKDELELLVIDAGASDIGFDEDGFILYTEPSELGKVKDNLDELSFNVNYAEIEYIAKEIITISSEFKKKIEKIAELLDENLDVANYYTNIDI